MKKNPTITVQENDTLLPFLLSRFTGKSRNYVKGILKRGQVTVDGKPCTDYARELVPGQIVCMLLEAAPEQYDPGFPIIYEDGDFVAIDKPAGLLAIATDRERENTAYHAVTAYVKSQNPSARVFIVHRLDRDTSGVMLFAKNEGIKQALQDSWEKAAIRRGYVAVVEGAVEPPDGTVKSWLRQTRTLFVYSAEREGDGKLAITSYKTLRVSDKTPRYTMLDISLETGRKNQIRVHMSDLGHPVAGDKKYGASGDPLGRLALHASQLIICHPATGDELRLEAGVPRVFNKLF